MLTSMVELMTRPPRMALGKDASPEGFARYLYKLTRGRLPFSTLLEVLQRSTEYDEIIRPVLSEIKYTYTKFLWRDPTVGEIIRHLTYFRTQLRTNRDRLDVVKAGNIRTYLNIRPLKMEMDIVNQCNLRCIMCHFSDVQFAKRKKNEIPVEEFASIAEQIFPLCSQLSLSLGAEPLLHRRLEELLTITAGYQIPYVYMHTNGTLLNERIIHHLVHSGMNQINISIDAATKQTYERIRVGSKFERVIDNIRAVNRIKEQLRSDTPRLCFNVTLMRSNIEELPAIIRLAHELGVVGVGTVHMMPFAIAVVDPLAESLHSHKSLCNQKLDEARALAEEYKVWVSLPEKFNEEAAPAPFSQIGKKHRDLVFLGDKQEPTTQPSCHFPWHFVGIDWDGGVNPCGWWFNEEPMGNIKTERFEEIWNNER